MLLGLLVHVSDLFLSCAAPGRTSLEEGNGKEQKAEVINNNASRSPLSFSYYLNFQGIKKHCNRKILLFFAHCFIHSLIHLHNLNSLIMYRVSTVLAHLFLSSLDASLQLFSLFYHLFPFFHCPLRPRSCTPVY
jgi:hypothetical protein